MTFAVIYLMLGVQGIVASLTVQPESRDGIDLLILRIPLVATILIYCMI